jgi:bifunctional polynucleotide phosphatase/kinase
MEEGFTEIRKVNFKFEGTEEEKRNWAMWLQIDGT